MNRMKQYLLIPGLLTMSLVAWGETCVTPTGATVPDGPVNASATFTPSNGTITVSLTNNLVNPRSAGQLLSGLAFTVSEGETAGILVSSGADIISVQQDSTFTDLGLNGTGWALSQNFNGGLELCVLCSGLGALGPSHLLIGQPDPSTGTYAFANRSIAQNAPHNPFTAGTATFTVSVPGVTWGSTITSATFFFSTTEGVSVGGSCSAPIGIF